MENVKEVMNLKDAFRYQNYLEHIMDTTFSYLNSERYYMKKTQEHLRNKANPEAQNEKVDMSTERAVEFDANTMIDFLVFVLDEKERVAKAIREAKAKCEVDIDAEAANNKKRQRAAKLFTMLGSAKPSEKIIRGSDYKFNAEGNQVIYAYEIKEVSVIDFDRNKVKKLAKQLATKADNTSASIDTALIEVKVDFDCFFDVNDTYDDSVEKFKETTKNEN